jgi:hypothetical protein
MTYATSGAYAGHFLFCADIGDSHVMEYLGPRSVADTALNGCGLDVQQGPDGYLYYTSASTIYRTPG